MFESSSYNFCEFKQCLPTFFLGAMALALIEGVLIVYCFKRIIAMQYIQRGNPAIVVAVDENLGGPLRFSLQVFFLYL